MAKDLHLNKPLSAAEMQQYLSENVVPNFSAMLNQEIKSTLFDVQGRVVLTTTKRAREIGFNCWQDAVGISYADVTREVVMRLLGEMAQVHLDKIVEACLKIHSLLLYAIAERKVINYIDLIPYNHKFKSSLETFIPVFHPHGEVVAVQSLSAEFKMFEFTDFLADTVGVKPIKELKIPSDEPPFYLPPRQHEILYLILQGIPQEFAAQILNIKRGTLARIISEQICPKFEIHGSNTKLLIEKAMRLGFHRYMPKSLWVPGVVILDPAVAAAITSSSQLQVS